MKTNLSISQDTIECPSIYVACLASYNAGYLHGRWIDLTIGFNAVWDEINAIIKDSPVEDAEEWEIHDTEYLPKRLCKDIQVLCNYAEHLREYGDKANLFACLCDDYDIDEAIEALDEKYIGEYDSEKDFIYDFVDQQDFLNNLPKHVQYYFDYDSYLRDMKLNSEIDIYEINGTIHVFYTN